MANKDIGLFAIWGQVSVIMITQFRLQLVQSIYVANDIVVNIWLW
jgi:hypothetical protein